MSTKKDKVEEKEVPVVVQEDLEDKVERLVEEKLEEEKKERTSKVTIWALVIVLILALGYIAYDKGLIFSNPSNNTDISDKDNNAGNKKDEEENENKDYITKLEVNDNTVVDLFNKMNNVAGHYCGVSEYYTNSKVTAASLGNEFVYELAVLNVEKMYGKVDITEAQFDNVVSSILGSNYKYNHIAYTNKCTRYVYNPNTKVYVYQTNLECGGSCGIHDLRKVVGAYKDDRTKTLTIEIGVLFANANADNTYSFYKDYKMTQAVTDYEKEDGVEYAKETIENAKKGTIYNMVFTLENGNYVYSYTEPSSK